MPYYRWYQTPLQIQQKCPNNQVVPPFIVVFNLEFELGNNFTAQIQKRRTLAMLAVSSSKYDLFYRIKAHYPSP
jgi:hypothetical protein